MKKKLSVFTLLMFVVCLLGCMKSRATEASYEFKGVVKDTSLNGDSILVTIHEEDELRKSAGDTIIVHLAGDKTNLCIGQEITVVYDGTIMESYPPQVNATCIKINGKGIDMDNVSQFVPVPAEEAVIVNWDEWIGKDQDDEVTDSGLGLEDVEEYPNTDSVANIN